MAKSNAAKRRGRPDGLPFVKLRWDLLNSRAYIALQPSAAKVLPYFLGKHGRENKDAPVEDWRPFAFPYAEAKRLGFARTTFSKAVTALVASGFVDVDEQGGLRGDTKSSSLYKISERWRRFGQPDFEEVRRYASEPRTKPGKAGNPNRAEAQRRTGMARSRIESSFGHKAGTVSAPTSPVLDESAA